MTEDAYVRRARSDLESNFTDRWNAMMSEWRNPPEPNMMWLAYAANYLFSTNGVKWAVDPILPLLRAPSLPDDISFVSLRDASFVLLTHEHGDHLDLELIKSLEGSKTRVVTPDHLMETHGSHFKTIESQVIVARDGERLELEGVEITPFTGLHWETRADGRIGVDATGYLLEIGERRWLIPGDVRDYDKDFIAQFAPVDIVFAHLWLGRGHALDPSPPLIKEFCDFILACQPAKVVIAHLYEFSRPPQELWSDRHVEMVVDYWKTTAPELAVVVPKKIEGVAL